MMSSPESHPHDDTKRLLQELIATMGGKAVTASTGFETTPKSTQPEGVANANVHVSLHVRGMHTPDGMKPIHVTFDTGRDGEPSLELQALRAVHDQCANDLRVLEERLRTVHPSQYPDAFAYYLARDSIDSQVRNLQDRAAQYRPHLAAVSAAAASGAPRVEFAGHKAESVHKAIVEGFGILAYQTDAEDKSEVHQSYLDAVQITEEWLD